MNLYLTHKCTRGCPFCFARKVLQNSGDDINSLLTIEEIKQLLKHFPEIEEQVKNVGLLGGEPFLYPYLDELLKLLSERGINAKIFTSATNVLPKVLADIDLESAIGKMNFVVNVGTRDTYNDKQFENLDTFLRKFSMLSSLSYTIFDLNTDPTYLFDLIDDYKLQRNIRTGIALPILHGGNEYIAKEDYEKAGAYFVQVAEKAAERGIMLSMDCGFTACMFNEKQIGRLLRLGSGVHFVCGTATDIGPGLLAWNCFPLFQIGRVNVMEASNLKELDKMLQDNVHAQLGPADGIFGKCSGCDLLRKKLCEGGCMSFKSTK